MNIIRTFLIAVILSQLFVTTSVFADISATLSLNPQNPLPNSTVTVTVESYSFNVNTAILTWKIDGVTQLTGRGKKSFVVKTGPVGTSVSVTIEAQTADGSSLIQEINIAPSSVILLYESPRSYVPLFYQGRSLPSTGAVVKVTALPQLSDSGKLLDPSDIAFTWYLNDSVLKEVSGAGKQSATIRLDYMESVNEIKVIARSPLGNTAMKTISIYEHPIMPLLYTYDPILGTNYNALVSKRFETTKDFSLVLEPFYVSQKEIKEPAYEWFLNGLPSTPLGGRILSLHPKEESYGSKVLTITVEGPDSRLQNAEAKVDIIFDTRK